MDQCKFKSKILHVNKIFLAYLNKLLMQNSSLNALLVEKVHFIDFSRSWPEVKMTPIVEKTINDPFVMMANPSVVVANMGFKMMFNTLAMSGPKEFIMIFLGHSTHSQKYFVLIFCSVTRWNSAKKINKVFLKCCWVT